MYNVNPKQMIQDPHIEQLLNRAMERSLSPDEWRELADWRRADSRREEAIRAFVGAWHKKNDLLPEEALQEEALENYLRFIRSRRSAKRLRLRPALISAAAVLLLLGVTLVFHLTTRPSETPVSPEFSSISPGGQKAELILGDGRVFALGDPSLDSAIYGHGGRIALLPQGLLYTEDASLKEVEYNTLRVPRGGEFTVALSDGSVVRLNSESEFRYPVNFQGTERRVHLSGEAFFVITADPEHPFVVESAQSAVYVRGTSFNHRAYPDEQQTVTTLVSGQVTLCSGDAEPIELQPCEQGIAGAGRLFKHTVDPYPFVAWKEGRFVFERQPLGEVMHTLARWYDLTVVFETPALKEIAFTGSLERFEGFEFIVQMMEMTGGVGFEIHGNTITIKEK